MLSLLAVLAHLSLASRHTLVKFHLDGFEFRRWGRTEIIPFEDAERWVVGGTFGEWLVAGPNGTETLGRGPSVNAAMTEVRDTWVRELPPWLSGRPSEDFRDVPYDHELARTLLFARGVPREQRLRLAALWLAHGGDPDVLRTAAAACSPPLAAALLRLANEAAHAAAPRGTARLRVDQSPSVEDAEQREREHAEAESVEAELAAAEGTIQSTLRATV